MAAFLSPVYGAGAQLFDNQGRVLSGGKINTYQSGTVTPLATWTDSTQGTQNANPIILDAYGRTEQEIWLQSGSTYKFIVTDANDNVLGLAWDNIAGLNDTSSASVSEWSATGLTPTYISATSFSVPGNNTVLFPVNQRIQAVVSAGTIYGYVTSSSFSSVTTVNVQTDSGSLDSGMSSINVGLLSSTNPSVPQEYLAANAVADVASAATTPIGAATSINVQVTGTTTITAFDTMIDGIIRVVRFAGALTLTHNGTSLILPGGANITTAANDQAVFRSKGSGNWECLSYQIAAFAPSTSFVPLNSQSANYTCVLGDANWGIRHPSTDDNPRTYTIPANASVAYAIGTTLTFPNEINTVTIAITSDTLKWSPSGLTGSRTLSANGMATALKIASTTWMITGMGLS